MALKSGQPDQAVDIEELLDHVDKTLDRVKVLYEQYFLGMQKQPPTHIHNDVERRLRDLMQIQIRNTGLRYRFATLQQKFGSYNTYWRRTLRQMENGTYIRQLSKISRQAALTGEEVPEEILAAMPKRMREQVKRDREQALAIARRREGAAETVPTEDDFLAEEAPATVPTPPVQSKTREPARGAHLLSDDDFDIDSFFAQIEASDAPAAAKPAPAAAKPAPAGSGSFPAVPAVASPAPAAARPAPSASQPTVPMPRPAAPPLTTTTVGRPAMPTPAPDTAPTVPIARPAMPTPPPAAGGRPAMPTPPPGTGARPGARPTMPTPPPGAGPRPQPSAAAKRPESAAPVRPPPGMNDADVNALYAKYVKAKEMVGEAAGPGAYSKLMHTINAQAPKIMEQYKAKGVEFSVVVKDNQVVIKAKPKI
ncbi:MAG TPA: MXAN_5187 C-terminal domain-containing protein [Kofleriaceae bacterium]|nr:MXAN_5187 C-terminal domain-containing protein [Kofleriaceae bacterium]